MPPLRLLVRRLGPLRDTEAVFGDVTLIVGRPNTGKSYLLRALYEAFAPGDPRGLASCIAEHRPMGLDKSRLLRIKVRVADAARGLFDAEICVNYKELVDLLLRGVEACFRRALLPEHDVDLVPPEPSLGERLLGSVRAAAARTLVEAYGAMDSLVVEKSGLVCVVVRKLRMPRSMTLAQWLRGETGEEHASGAEDTVKDFELYLRVRFPLRKLIERCFAYASRRRVVYAAYGRSIAVQTLLYSVILGTERPYEVDIVRDMLGERSLPLLSLYEAAARGYVRMLRDEEEAKKMLKAFEPLLMGRIRAEPGELFYEFDGSGLPIKFASALAAEAAALMLAATGLTGENAEEHWLLVEEPESQLHPVMHPVAAAVLLNLASEGVKLVATTHSDLFAATLLELVLAARRRRLHDAAKRLSERLGVHLPPLDEERLRRLDVQVLYTEAADDGSYRIRRINLEDAVAKLPGLSDVVLEVARWSLEQTLY